MVMDTRLPGRDDAAEAWRLAGGGARNAVLAQALADALGETLALLAHPGEATAPALLAFAAIGRTVLPRVERRLAPDPARRARFARLYAIYRGLYPALADSMHELGRLADQKEDR